MGIDENDIMDGIEKTWDYFKKYNRKRTVIIFIIGIFLGFMLGILYSVAVGIL